MNKHRPLHPGSLTDPGAIREFVFAGDARITLVSYRTDARFTYRVQAAKGDGPASHFVSVLTGSDNASDYTYLGLYRQDGSYSHGWKSTISADAPGARAWTWFDAKVLRDGTMPRLLEVWHEGRCGRCGRPLTVPSSIASGLGPECAGKM